MASNHELEPADWVMIFIVVSGIAVAGFILKSARILSIAIVIAVAAFLYKWERRPKH